MRSTASLLTMAFLGASLFLMAGSAPAAGAPQGDPKALARKHFERAELLYRQGEFRRAIEEYKAAQTHLRDPAFVFNIAQCHRQLMEWDRALFFYELYLSEVPDAPNKAEVTLRIKEAREKIEEAKRAKEARGRLSVITKPEGAAIRVNNFSGPPVATSPAIIPLPAGQHLVQIHREGYEKVHRRVTVEVGHIAMVELSLTPEPGSGVTPPTEDPRRVEPPREDPRRVEPPTEDPPREDPRRVEPPREDPRRIPPGGGEVSPPPQKRPFYATWWFWTGAGASVVLGVFGTVVGVSALSQHARFVRDGDPKDFRYMRSSALMSDGLFLGTAAVAITTIIITAVYERRRRAERPAAILAPSCGPGGCGITLTGRF